MQINNGSGIEDDQYRTDIGFSALLLFNLQTNGERIIRGVFRERNKEIRNKRPRYSVEWP